MNSRIRRPLYISFKSWLCCCSLPSVAPQQLLLLLLILLVTGPWSLGTDKKSIGVSAKGDLGWAQCLSSVPTFSQSQGLVFRLSRYFGQMVLIHGWPWNIIWHGPWSLYQACSLTTLYPYVSAHRQAKDENFFIFSDRLNLVFIPLLRYFDSVMQNGYMQLQVWDIKIQYDLLFLHVFILVTYPA